MTGESTTPDLEELNRRLIDAWNRRDVDAAMSLFDRDAVWEATGLGAEHLRGLTAIRGHLEDNLRPYEEYKVRLEEFLDLGNGVSLSVTLHSGRLVGGSGVVQMRIGAVVLREGGLIMRVRTSIDIDQARVSAERLAEERAQADV
jgi:ketosteroid isomerase-like protein